MARNAELRAPGSKEGSERDQAYLQGICSVDWNPSSPTEVVESVLGLTASSVIQHECDRQGPRTQSEDENKE